MVSQVSVKRVLLVIAVLALGIFIGIQLSAAAPVATADSGGQQPSSEADASALGVAYHACTPENVGAYDNRIHVKCTVAAPNNIRFFALSTADSRHAARVFSLMLTSKASNKKVGIYYDPDDLSGSAIGCLNNDCRLILSAFYVD